jgi:hypothetical protein
MEFDLSDTNQIIEIQLFAIILTYTDYNLQIFKPPNFQILFSN